MVLGVRRGLAARSLSGLGGARRRKCGPGLVRVGEIDNARLGSRLDGQRASESLSSWWRVSAEGRMSRVYARRATPLQVDVRV